MRSIAAGMIVVAMGVNAANYLRHAAAWVLLPRGIEADVAYGLALRHEFLLICWSALLWAVTR